MLGIYIEIYPTQGTPQDGVLSLRAWNICCDELLIEIKKLGRNPFGFADDVAYVQHGNNLDTMIDVAQQHLDAAVDWATRHGLKISAKNICCIFYSQTQICYNKSEKIVPRQTQSKLYRGNDLSWH